MHADRLKDNFTILLVEDDQVDTETVKRLLKKQAIDNPLVCAGDGVEALEMLDPDRNGGVPQPCLILLDLNMPRMNGLEFLQRVRESEALRSNIVFVLSTSARNEDRVKAYYLNAAAYFLKEDMLGMAEMLKHYCAINQMPDSASGR